MDNPENNRQGLSEMFETDLGFAWKSLVAISWNEHRLELDKNRTINFCILNFFYDPSQYLNSNSLSLSLSLSLIYIYVVVEWNWNPTLKWNLIQSLVRV